VSRQAPKKKLLLLKSSAVAEFTPLPTFFACESARKK
jgi:hypothetical protein